MPPHEEGLEMTGLAFSAGIDGRQYPLGPGASIDSTYDEFYFSNTGLIARLFLKDVYSAFWMDNRPDIFPTI